MKAYLSKVSLISILFLFNGCTLQLKEFDLSDDFQWRTVVKVVDGDTINLEDPDNDKPERVRLIGIDAPETRRSRNKEVHPFGKASTEYLKTLIGTSKVRLEYDVRKTDRYGRTLAYIYLPDGTFINAKMVEEGYAVIMTVQPNSRHADDFYQLQVQARKAGKGIWSNDWQLLWED